MMTDAGLSAAIKAQIEAEFGTPSDSARLQKFCDAMGKAIVDYIQANADVLPGTFTADGFPVLGLGEIE
jgi:hypothetical protein